MRDRTRALRFLFPIAVDAGWHIVLSSYCVIKLSRRHRGRGLHPGEAALEFVGMTMDQFLNVSQRGPGDRAGGIATVRGGGHGKGD